MVGKVIDTSREDQKNYENKTKEIGKVSKSWIFDEACTWTFWWTFRFISKKKEKKEERKIKNKITKICLLTNMF